MERDRDIERGEKGWKEIGVEGRKEIETERDR